MRDGTRIGRLVACLSLLPPVDITNRRPVLQVRGRRRQIVSPSSSLAYTTVCVVVICPQIAISEVKLGFLDLACNVHLQLLDGPLAHMFHHWHGAKIMGQDFILAIAAVFALTIHTT